MKQDARRAPAGRVSEDVLRFRKSLGRVIADIREGMLLSQAAFAEKLGCDQSTVAHAEQGKHLWRIETWLEVSRVLKVPFYELFRRAAERDTRGANMDRRVEALDAEEVELVRLWRQLTVEGRGVLLGRARACVELYHREHNVVPLVSSARAGRHRKSS